MALLGRTKLYLSAALQLLWPKQLAAHSVDLDPTNAYVTHAADAGMFKLLSAWLQQASPRLLPAAAEQSALLSAGPPTYCHSEQKASRFTLLTVVQLALGLVVQQLLPLRLNCLLIP